MKILLTRKHSSRMRTTRFCGSGEGVGYLWSHVPSSGREVGYSGGRQWRIYIVKFWTRAPPPGSKFFQFHAVFGKIWQNRMLAPPPPESWRPLPREILDPPLVGYPKGVGYTHRKKGHGTRDTLPQERT